MSEIRRWLEAIGLSQYADAFEVNDIGMDLLKQVDDQTLKDIGVASAGHRLRIRNAIAKLTTAPAAQVNVSAIAHVFGDEAPIPLDQLRAAAVIVADDAAWVLGIEPSR
jgi:hypothetical protein